MSKKQKNENIDIIGKIKSMDKKIPDKTDVNKLLAEVLKKILEYIKKTTNLNKRNIRPISILQTVPIWKNVVNQLVGNLPHINNSLKDTFKDLFIELSKAIQSGNELDIDMLFNKQFKR